MSKKYDTISIENSSCEEVRSILRSEFGLVIGKDEDCCILGIHFDVQDYTYEFEYGRDFIEKNGLQEEHPFYRDFDVKGFNTVIDLWSSSSGFSSEFQTIVTDQIGKCISLKLKTRVVIAFENNEIPFCIYDNGIKTNDLTEYYKNYFVNRAWIPNK